MAQTTTNKGGPQGVLTEVDVVRHIVKDLIDSYLQDKEFQKRFLPVGMHPPRAFSEGTDNEDIQAIQLQKKTVFKLYMRIWITCMRQIRNHCDRFEGRPIELKHIGMFYKLHRDGHQFSYIPNEDLLLDGKLRVGQENDENKTDMPKEVKEICDGHAAQLNLQTIASICDCKPDLVQTFLNRFKQVSLELLNHKTANQMVLNLRFGVIHINRLSGEIDFKTLHQGTDTFGPTSGGLTQAKLAALGGQPSNINGEKSVSQLSYFSRPALSQTKSTLESNLRSFQTLQQNQGRGFINASYAPSQISASPSKLPSFNQRSQSVKGGDPFGAVLKPLSVHGGDNKSQFGQGGGIDKQSTMSVKKLFHRSAHKENASRQAGSNSLNHLKSFLQTQQNMYKEKSKDILSLASDPIKKSQQYIDQIADLKKQNADPDTIKTRAEKYAQMDYEKWRSKQQKSNPGSAHPPKPQTASKKNNSVVSQKQGDETPQQGDLPALKVELLPQNEEGRNLSQWRMSNTMSVAGGGFHKSGLDLGVQSILPSKVYQGVPAFLRSEGPFTVYNHHKVKGEEYYENAKLTKSQAKLRIQQQLDDLRQRKEQEKKLFYEQIHTEEENFKIQQQLRRLQNIENQQFVKMQMEHREKTKKFEHDETKQVNTKPHFGPEENEEVALYMKHKRIEQQEKVRLAYLKQIELSQLDRKLERELELAKDTKNLETIIEMQNSEEQAKKLMHVQNQQRLKKAWLEQMEFKKVKHDYERIFE